MSTMSISDLRIRLIAYLQVRWMECLVAEYPYKSGPLQSIYGRCIHLILRLKVWWDACTT